MILGKLFNLFCTSLSPVGIIKISQDQINSLSRFINFSLLLIFLISMQTCLFSHLKNTIFLSHFCGQLLFQPSLSFGSKSFPRNFQYSLLFPILLLPLSVTFITVKGEVSTTTLNLLLSWSPVTST